MGGHTNRGPGVPIQIFVHVSKKGFHGKTPDTSKLSPWVVHSLPKRSISLMHGI